MGKAMVNDRTRDLFTLYSESRTNRRSERERFETALRSGDGDAAVRAILHAPPSRAPGVDGSSRPVSEAKVRPSALVVSDARELVMRERVEESAEFRFVWDECPTPMAWVTEDGFVEWCNDALAEFLGYDKLELVGMHFTQVTAGEDREADRRAFEEVVAGKRKEYTMMKLYQPRMGAAKPGKLRVVKSPFTTPSSNKLLMLGTVLPIDPFELIGDTKEEQDDAIDKAVGAFLRKHWKQTLLVVLAVAGVSNIAEIAKLIGG